MSDDLRNRWMSYAYVWGGFMKKIISLFVVVVTSLLLGQSAIAADQDKLAERLLVASGLKVTINRIPSEVETGFRQQGGDLAALAGVMSQAFDTREMARVTQLGIANALSVKEFQYALKWLDSPLGKRITAMEDEGGEAVEKRIAKMMKRPIEKLASKRRLEIIHELDEATRTLESSVDLVLYMQGALMIGVSSVNPNVEKLDADEIVEMLEQQRDAVTQELQQYLTVTMIHTYRKLTDKELRRYVRFADTKMGRSYHDAILESFKVAFLEQAKQAGEALGRALLKKTENQGV